MFKLCGFAASNYYNAVQLALLEKGVPFEEQLVWLGETDSAASPLGKVPYALTDEGPLCESTVILEYLEARYPEHPLLPANPYLAAKVRELVRFIELHLELVARNLYPEAFFGGKVSDSLKAAIRPQLDKGVAGLTKLVKFAPFIAGDQFTLADCVAVAHLPLVSRAGKIIYGQDLLAQLPLKDYLKHLGERPAVQKVNAARKIGTEQLMARMKQAQG